MLEGNNCHAKSTHLTLQSNFSLTTSKSTSAHRAPPTSKLTSHAQVSTFTSVSCPSTSKHTASVMNSVHGCGCLTPIYPQAAAVLLVSLLLPNLYLFVLLSYLKVLFLAKAQRTQIMMAMYLFVFAINCRRQGYLPARTFVSSPSICSLSSLCSMAKICWYINMTIIRS